MTIKSIRNAVKAIMIEDESILLIKHKSDRIYYTLPGGGIKHNENIYDALRRECLEETGLKIRVLDLLFLTEYIADKDALTIQDKGFHQIDMYFQCEVIHEAEINQAIEYDKTQIAYEWVAIDKLEELIFYPESLKERIGKISQEIFISDKK